MSVYPTFDSCFTERLLTAHRAIELIRREILRQHPETLEVNAVLIDFFLYDLAKEREASGKSYAKRCLRIQGRLGICWISRSVQALP